MLAFFICFSLTNVLGCSQTWSKVFSTSCTSPERSTDKATYCGKGNKVGKNRFFRGAEEKEAYNLSYATYVCPELESRMQTDPSQ